MSRPSASQRAQDMSMAFLRLFEYAVRTSAMAISSTMVSSAFLISSSRMGSLSSLVAMVRLGGGPCPPSETSPQESLRRRSRRSNTTASYVLPPSGALCRRDDHDIAVGVQVRLAVRRHEGGRIVFVDEQGTVPRPRVEILSTDDRCADHAVAGPEVGLALAAEGPL